MHKLDQKIGDWRAPVMVRLARHDQSSTGIDQSLEEQGHGPRELRCCVPGPAAHFLYWLEDLIIQQDLHQHSPIMETLAATQELLR